MLQPKSQEILPYLFNTAKLLRGQARFPEMTYCFLSYVALSILSKGLQQTHREMRDIPNSLGRHLSTVQLQCPRPAPPCHGPSFPVPWPLELRESGFRKQ